MPLLPAARFWGVGIAAFLLLAGLAIMALRLKVPPILFRICLALALLFSLGGWWLSHVWSVTIPVAHWRQMTGRQGALANRLFQSRCYTHYFGLSPSDRIWLANGLHATTTDQGCVIAFSAWGWGPDGAPQDLQQLFPVINDMGRDSEGIRLAAGLLTAESAEALIRILKNRPALSQLRKPARLVLRDNLPELFERFPGAHAILADFERAIGSAKK